MASTVSRIFQIHFSFENGNRTNSSIFNLQSTVTTNRQSLTIKYTIERQNCDMVGTQHIFALGFHGGLTLPWPGSLQYSNQYAKQKHKRTNKAPKSTFYSAMRCMWFLKLYLALHRDIHIVIHYQVKQIRRKMAGSSFFQHQPF